MTNPTNTSKNNNSNTNNTINDNITPNPTPSDSPQPPQVPKNSPKDSPEMGKENIEISNANKILLGLIKKDTQQDLNELNQTGTHLLEMLNKKPNQPNNILNTLFTAPLNTNNSNNNNNNNNKLVNNNKQASSPTPRHFPQILTAQELEMSQINEQNKTKLPMEINVKEAEKNSDAYKQLVKSLSSQVISPKPNDIVQKLQQKQIKQVNESNDATKVLRQMLNLNKIEEEVVKKTTPKSKKYYHHKHNKSAHLSKSQSNNESFDTKPTVASPPHQEKPLENLNPIQKLDKDVLLGQAPSNNSSSNSLKNFIDKINKKQEKTTEQKSEQEHFNLLLNKINIVPQSQEVNNNNNSNTNNNILKWFTAGNAPNGKLTLQGSTNLSPTTLSEIEFIENHQRPIQINNKNF